MIVELGNFGAGDGIRTRDNLLGRQARYRCVTPAVSIHSNSPLKAPALRMREPDVQWSESTRTERGPGTEEHVAERYFMYDPALRDSVLRLLRKWKRLPMSDLFQLLSAEDRLRFRDDVIEDLVWQGHIQQEKRGDETVLSITEAGEQANIQSETATRHLEPS